MKTEKSIRRKRVTKYIRRIGALWKAFAHHDQIGAGYVMLDAEGKRLLQKCIDLQREFVHYYPHPENIRLLKLFEGFIRPTGSPPTGGNSQRSEALLKNESAFILFVGDPSASRRSEDYAARQAAQPMVHQP